MSLHVKVAGKWVEITEGAGGGGSSGPTWAKVTGGTVTTYTKPNGDEMEVHAFTADADVTITQAGLAEVLVVGGGAGGSRNIPDGANGRGGNAGQVVPATLLLEAGTIHATVGAGGTEQGGAGGQSKFGVIPAAGGTNKGGGGAGDGAGAVGGDAADAAGGIGVEWLGNWYGGGGGAGGHGGGATAAPGAGGQGGGGAGAVLGSGLEPKNTPNSGVNPAMNGAPNTGGGGGASGTWFSPGQSDWGRGGAGGSGVVLVAVQTNAPTGGGSGGSAVEPVATGGTVSEYTENGKKYRAHTFLADGTFTIDKDTFVEVLLVGGGGRGGDSVDADRGWQTGGGSGGGGQVLETKIGVPAGTVPIKVGAGGQDSMFGTTIARRGGNGASHGNGEGGAAVGGGGGGCMYHNAGGDPTVAGQGAPGGAGGSLASGGGGGGGGKDGTPGGTGTGGTGTTSSFSGAPVRYGDGGPSAMTPNLGMGGNGAPGGGSGQPGSSGIVIVRYELPSGGSPAPAYNEATGGTTSLIENYNGTGKRFRVHEFTANGDFVVTKAVKPFSAVVGGAGGGGGQDAQGTPGGRGGHGQGIEDLAMTLEAKTYPVVVGAGGGGAGLDGWGQGNGGGGGASSFNGVSATGGGGGHGPGDQNHPQSPSIGSPDGPQITSTVSGTSATYGGNGGPPGSRDAGHQQGYDGSPGKVVIAYEVV